MVVAVLSDPDGPGAAVSVLTRGGDGANSRRPFTRTAARLHGK